MEKIISLNIYRKPRHNINPCLISCRNSTDRYRLGWTRQRRLLYSFYTEWCQVNGNYLFKLYWKINGESFTLIPNSRIFLPTLFGSSPYNIKILSSICGDGYKTSTEACDDKNISNGDGCSASCAIETGWTCSGGSISSKDTCTEICGDSIKLNSISTYCDDGNTSNGDGCNSTCSIESGWHCSGGSSNTKDTCVEICGDGIRFNSLTTYCDDGNKISGDGCSSTCLIETGWNCAGGTSTAKDVCNDICGDGKKYIPLTTYCDDGNKLSGDGCSNDCNIESGWNCAGGNSLTKDTCTEICGDGIRFNSLSPYCDDANKINGDGCNSSCSVETGWKCTGGNSTTKDKCDEVCGDGIRFNSNNTYCDDGNRNNGDGCNSICSIEVGWSCLGGTTSNKDICTEICGDGIRFNTVNTYCDDGNNSNEDGCGSNCLIETGWECSGGNSSTLDICKEICGDGIRFNTNSAYCDDENLLNGDGCNSNCSTEIGWICTNGNSSMKDTCSSICGDGYKAGKEACDDKNSSSGDGCSSSCVIETGWACSGGSISSKDTCTEICGDGIKFNTISTYCDDGNLVNGDGCSSICSIESGWHCSGGSSNTKDTCVEICGDGIKFNSISTYCDHENTSNGDGCSSSCQVESGWRCSGGSSTMKDTCVEICGDSKRFNTNSTYCDDGNTSSGDGCSSTCSVESGWICSGGNSSTKDVCVEICGDGKKFNNNSTYCDDSNTTNGDGCNSSCLIETGWACSGGSISSKDTCTEICGDSIKFNSISTYCDDGNLVNGDGCSSICSVESGWHCSGENSNTKATCVEICGDGKKFNSNGTYCDDGNTASGDGCSSTCSIESGWSCSRGSVTIKDTCSEICGDGIRFNNNSTYCDDGNLINGDGCNSLCEVEYGFKCYGKILTSKSIEVY